MLRDIVEERRMLTQLEKFQPDYRRIDEFLDGVKWILARDPEYGTLVSDVPIIRRVSMASQNNIPALQLYYTYDDQKVCLLEVEPDEVT